MSCWLKHRWTTWSRPAWYEMKGGGYHQFQFRSCRRCQRVQERII